MDGENRITLNVGGIRFETYKVSWGKVTLSYKCVIQNVVSPCR